jgi:hypothetical protein
MVRYDRGKPKKAMEIYLQFLDILVQINWKIK